VGTELGWWGQVAAVVLVIMIPKGENTKPTRTTTAFVILPTDKGSFEKIRATASIQNKAYWARK
jgi:hypothetical protein